MIRTDGARPRPCALFRSVPLHREASEQKDVYKRQDKQYFFVIYDDATGLEVFRHPVIMDMAFADDYGFGF